MCARLVGGAPRRTLAALIALIALGGPAMWSPAQAEEWESSDDDGDVPESRGHKGQLGLSLQLGVALRGIFPYDGEFCGASISAASTEACVGRAPLTLDIGLSYGVTQMLEILVEMRVGVERDIGALSGELGPRSRAYAPGIRYYLSETSRAKLFSTLQLVLDTTEYPQAPGTDLAIKNTNGFLYDITRNIGVYAFVGEIVGWQRWLRGEIELGLGVQGRYF